MVKQTQKKQRIVTRTKVTPSATTEKPFETDSTYFLKLVVFVLLGTLWLKFKTPVIWIGLPFNAIPLGFFAGLILINRLEKHQSDRKIWYAAMLIVTIICYFVPAGVAI